MLSTRLLHQLLLHLRLLVLQLLDEFFAEVKEQLLKEIGSRAANLRILMLQRSVYVQRELIIHLGRLFNGLSLALVLLQESQTARY